MAEYWHLNPKTGTPTRCNAAAGRCPFGTGNQHFLDPNQAAQAAAEKLSEFHDWVSRSVVPQQPGYFTEHVFDPKRVETMSDYGPLVGSGVKLADGTRLIIENGWTLQVPNGLGDAGMWNAVQSVPGRPQPNHPDFKDTMEVGMLHDEVDLWWRIRDLGARLDVPDEATPIRMKWVPEVGGY